MKRFVLYGTEACHLCEQALGLLEEASIGLDVTVVGWSISARMTPCLSVTA